MLVFSVWLFLFFFFSSLFIFKFLFYFFLYWFFSLFVFAATNPGLDLLDWTCFFIWSGVVVLPCGLHCPMHLCPFGVRQASVNCPLPMVKLLQTPRCYGDWRHLWVVPWTRPQPPSPGWELKTHSMPAKQTSMYLAHTINSLLHKQYLWACVCVSLLPGSNCVVVRGACVHLPQWQ